ncbi:MAG: terminase TerL endonuclease subunit, partial [Coriobacteriales bacterium]
MLDHPCFWLALIWVKANPFLCTTESGLASLRNDAQTARDMGGSELRDFLIKSLNMWVQNTDDQFINTEKWKACADTRTLKDFRGRTCYVGLDLSSGG